MVLVWALGSNRPQISLLWLHQSYNCEGLNPHSFISIERVELQKSYKAASSRDSVTLRMSFETDSKTVDASITG